MAKIKIKDLTLFLDNINKLVMISFPLINKHGSSIKKLIVKLIVEDIIRCWDELDGRTIERKVSYYAESVLEEHFLNDRIYSTVESVIQSPVAVALLISRLDMFFREDMRGVSVRLDFMGAESIYALYELFGETKYEIFFNLVINLVEQNLDLAKILIPVLLTEEALLNLFIYYFNSDEENKERACIGLIKILKDVYEANSNIVRPIIIKLIESENLGIDGSIKLFRFMIQENGSLGVEDVFRRLLVNEATYDNPVIFDWLESVLDGELDLSLSEEDFQNIINCLIQVYKKATTGFDTKKYITRLILRILKERSVMLSEPLPYEGEENIDLVEYLLFSIIQELEEKIEEYLETEKPEEGFYDAIEHVLRIATNIFPAKVLPRVLKVFMRKRFFGNREKAIALLRIMRQRKTGFCLRILRKCLHIVAFYKYEEIILFIQEIVDGGLVFNLEVGWEKRFLRRTYASFEQGFEVDREIIAKLVWSIIKIEDVTPDDWPAFNEQEPVLLNYMTRLIKKDLQDLTEEFVALFMESDESVSGKLGEIVRVLKITEKFIFTRTGDLGPEEFSGKATIHVTPSVRRIRKILCIREEVYEELKELVKKYLEKKIISKYKTRKTKEISQKAPRNKELNYRNYETSEIWNTRESKYWSYLRMKEWFNIYEEKDSFYEHGIKQQLKYIGVK